MELIIYSMPKSDTTITSSDIVVSFESDPAPKLIKYGFNNINEQLNMVILTETPYYHNGLEFDFDREDKQGIVAKAKVRFGIKNFDITFAAYWEIFTIFNLLTLYKSVVIFDMSHKDTLSDIVSTYTAMANISVSSTIVDTYKTIPKAGADIVIYKYSDIDIDENAATQFITDALPKLLSVQKVGSTMVLQLFNMQTRATAEIIYLLSTLYAESHLIKPTIISDLSDEKYIVLINLLAPATLKIPRHPDTSYIASMGLTVPDSYDVIIQCMNSNVVPKKYKLYNIIMSYLNTKVYDGADAKAFALAQDSNTKRWLDTFGNLDGIGAIVDESIKKTDEMCNTLHRLNTLFN